MLFDESCKCCVQNQTIVAKTKQRFSQSSKRYYDRNSNRIILKTLNRYYKNKQRVEESTTTKV